MFSVLELVFVIFVELFIWHALLSDIIEAAIAAETEAMMGKTTINYKAASPVVKTAVVMAAVDAVASKAAPEAGNSGNGGGSSGGGSVGSANIGVDGGDSRDGDCG
jgi:hypothetical protein